MLWSVTTDTRKLCHFVRKKKTNWIPIFFRMLKWYTNLRMHKFSSQFLPFEGSIWLQYISQVCCQIRYQTSSSICFQYCQTVCDIKCVNFHKTDFLLWNQVRVLGFNNSSRLSLPKNSLVQLSFFYSFKTFPLI